MVMKIMLLFLGVSLFLAGPAPDQAALMEGKPCELKGQVFIETTEAFADYRVYVESVQSFADISVYREEVSSFATEPGLWYFTDVQGFADFSIFLVDNPQFADFSVFYTEFRGDVGCK
jgi:hypothetical protein